jgi:hypothetical protein
MTLLLSSRRVGDETLLKAALYRKRLRLLYELLPQACLFLILFSISQ